MPLNKFSVAKCVAVLFLFAFTAVPARSEELVSVMEMDFSGVTAVDGIRIVPVTDIPAKIYTEDYAPSQVFEIIRNNQAPITVGRLMTSCTCIRAVMEKKTFAQGERAIIELRNVKPSQPGGATYMIFARLNQPFSATIQHNVFVQSTMTPGSVPQAQPVVIQEQVYTSSVPSVEAKPKPRSLKYDEIVPFTSKTSEEKKEEEKPVEEK